MHQSRSIDNDQISGDGPESFQRIIGGIKADAFHSIEQTGDNGYIICGYTENDSASEKDILILKTDSNGETLWYRKYSDSFSNLGWDIELVDNGDVVIAATKFLQEHSDYKSNPFSGQLLKISGSGEELWNKTFDFGTYTHFSKIKQTSDYGSIVVGSDYSSGRGIILKTDRDGNELWKHINASLNEITAVDNTGDEGFIFCGVDNASNEIAVIRMNKLGIALWGSSLGNTFNSKPTAIKTVASGYIICGYNAEISEGASGFIKKLNQDGDELWSRNYMSDSLACLDGLIEASDKNFIAIGRDDMGEFSKACLIKISSTDGDVIWQRKFDPGDKNRLYDLEQTNDGGYVLAGESVKLENVNAWLIKVNEEGE